MNDRATQKLAEDFKILMHDVEGMLKATASQAGEHIGDLRQRLKNRIEDSRKALSGGDKTWLGLVAAAGIGAILGFLMRRRD